MLDHIIQYKGEAKKIENEIVMFTVYILAHNGFSFDSYDVLNKLLQWRTVVSLIKNGSGMLSLKLVNAYVNQN